MTLILSEIAEEEFETKPLNSNVKITAVGNGALTIPDKKKPKPLGLTPKAILMQVTMSVMANSCAISLGIGFAFPTITFDSLTDQSNPNAITKDEASWYASMSSICMPIGCIISSFVLDHFGRKKALYTLNVVSIVSWIIMATASTTDSYTLYVEILFSRVLIGIATGMGVSASCVYSAEVADKNNRGKLIILTTLNISFGTLITYTLGYCLPNQWRLVSAISCAFAVMSLIFACIIPETPPWLAAKGQVIKAEKRLRQFKGLPKSSSFINSELRLELDWLRQQNITKSTNKVAGNLLSKFRQPEVYKPLGIMLAFSAFQQISGIFVIFVYTAQISKEAGVNIDPFLCAIFIGAIRFVTTIVVSLLLDKLGRRKLALFSGCSMSLCMFGLCVYVHYKVTTCPWLPVLLLLAFVFASTSGMLTLPLAMTSEMFPQSVKGLLSGIVHAVSFAIMFGMIKLYPTMMAGMGNDMVFLFYGCISTGSVVFCFFCLPETKDKSLEEVGNIFKGVRKESVIISEAEKRKMLENRDFV